MEEKFELRPKWTKQHERNWRIGVTLVALAFVGFFAFLGYLAAQPDHGPRQGTALDNKVLDATNAGARDVVAGYLAGNWTYQQSCDTDDFFRLGPLNPGTEEGEYEAVDQKGHWALNKTADAIVVTLDQKLVNGDWQSTKPTVSTFKVEQVDNDTMKMSDADPQGESWSVHRCAKGNS